MAADYPRCPFEKAILSTRCGCELSMRSVLGEAASRPSLGNCSMRCSTSCIHAVVARGPRLAPIGERIGVHGRPDIARNNCFVLLELLRGKSRFVLKVSDTTGRMPFGKEMKVMLGGLEGLAQELDDTGVPTSVENIHALVSQAQQRFGTLTSLPYDRIVRSITARQVRRRGPSDPVK